MKEDSVAEIKYRRATEDERDGRQDKSVQAESAVNR